MEREPGCDDDIDMFAPTPRPKRVQVAFDFAARARDIIERKKGSSLAQDARIRADAFKNAAGLKEEE